MAVTFQVLQVRSIEYDTLSFILKSDILMANWLELQRKRGEVGTDRHPG